MHITAAEKTGRRSLYATAPAKWQPGRTALAPDPAVRITWGYHREPSTTNPRNDRSSRAGITVGPVAANAGTRLRGTRPVNGNDDLAKVGAFLDSVRCGPATLVIEGEPGIGKTTLWLAALDEARRSGFTVLSTRSSAAEFTLSLVGLEDLLGDVDSTLIEALPVTHRAAIRHAAVSGVCANDIRRDGDSSDDRRSVAAAFRAVLEEIATRGPVLVAVDDVQWIDAATRDVLSYALRRVTGPVGVVVTETVRFDRPSTCSWLDLGHARQMARVMVSPMPLDQLHRLMTSRTGRSFPRSAMTRIAEISRGNPYYALELALSMDAGDSAYGHLLPARLADVFGLRVDRLDADVRDVLLAAASVAEPTVDLLAAILSCSADEIVAYLEVPEKLGAIAISGGKVNFSHPVLSHIAYSQAHAADRRRIHRAIASVEPVLERRAMHLGLAATTGDPETLTALDAAAHSARTKAAPATAAQLLELAISLGGDTAFRRITAAHNHFLAGDIDRAGVLVEPALGELTDGPLLAHGRLLLGGVSVIRGDVTRALSEFDGAAVEADPTSRLAVRIHSARALTLSIAGADGAGLHTQRARSLAEHQGDDAAIAEALSADALVSCLSGAGVDEVSLQRAIDIEHAHGGYRGTAAPFSARTVKAITLAWTGRLNEARSQLVDAQVRCAARGTDCELPWLQAQSAMVDIWLGRYAEAAETAEHVMVGAEQLGGHLARAVAAQPRALLAALQGREYEAREEIDRVVSAGDETQKHLWSDGPRMVLGFLELSLGNHHAAIDALQPLVARRDVGGQLELAAFWFLPDLVEAASAVGRLDEFEPWVDALEVNGTLVQRPWMIAVGARCRMMLLAARGDLSAAADAAENALRAHRTLPMPFELARTQLAVGQLRRRMRQKNSAREILQEAMATFERLGTPLWEARARAELSRAALGPSAQILTPSELCVAELAAAGMTNKDVAAALYISPKTVEHNLGRVYRKLGIRNRTELGRQIDEFREQPR